MKLTSAQVERTLDQFEAQAIPENHPLIPQLSRIFGDHTFFLDSHGLNIVEPAGAQSGEVMNVADWGDANLTSLSPHEPQSTDVVVVLEPTA